MSVLKSVLLAAVIGAGFIGSAGSAYAQDPVFTLKLESPVAAPTRIIADSAVWNCNGDTCSAHVDHGVNVHGCRQFTHHANLRVTAYGTADRQLSSDEVSRCNEAAAVAAATN